MRGPIRKVKVGVNIFLRNEKKTFVVDEVRGKVSMILLDVLIVN